MDHTKSSLSTTIVDYLTKEIAYLNRKNENMFKLLDNMETNLKYTKDFIKKTPNIKDYKRILRVLSNNRESLSESESRSSLLHLSSIVIFNK